MGESTQGIHSGLETQGRRHQESNSRVSVAPRKGPVSSQYFRKRLMGEISRDHNICDGRIRVFDLRRIIQCVCDISGFYYKFIRQYNESILLQMCRWLWFKIKEIKRLSDMSFLYCGLFTKNKIDVFVFFLWCKQKDFLDQFGQNSIKTRSSPNLLFLLIVYSCWFPISNF